MSNVASNEEPTIGGLPASRFEGRRIKAMLPDGIFTTVIGRGFHKKSIVVDAVIQNRLRQYHVAPKHVKPNWVENEDLQQEAVALGLRFTGEVNVGRALEVAKESAAKEELSKAQQALNQLQEMKHVKEEPTQTVVATSPVPVVELPPPPVEVIPEVAAPPEQKEEVRDVPTGFAEITGVSASIAADPTWTADFAELQKLVAALKGRDAKIAKLRAELAALEGSAGDDAELIDLFVETLAQKGVTVQRGPAAPIAPADRFVSGFEQRLTQWITGTRPASFNFVSASEAGRVRDVSSTRAVIRDVADRHGYIVVPSRRGRPQEFVKEWEAGDA